MTTDDHTYIPLIPSKRPEITASSKEDKKDIRTIGERIRAFLAKKVTIRYRLIDIFPLRGKTQVSISRGLKTVSFITSASRTPAEIRKMALDRMFNL